VTARTIRRRPSAAPTVLVTAFVSLLAAGAGGCKSVSTPTATRGNAPSELRQKAGLASVSIPNDAHRGAFTNQTYFEQGREVQLPQRWVTEARVATAESEARRGAAEAFRVRADADFADSTAQADSDLARAFSQHEIALAGTDRAKNVFDAKINEFDERVDAKAISYEASHRRSETLLQASVREWQAEVERMRSQAESEWEQALAEHERMLAERQAVNERGGAMIDQMIQTASLTEQRAAERVADLRSQSRTVAEQTAAKITEISQEITTVRETTAAAVADLTQKAESLEKDSAARIAEMLSEADTLEATDVDEQFRLAILGAEVAYENAMAQAEELRKAASAKADSYRAESERRRAEADRSLELARVTYTEAQDWIAGNVEEALADVAVHRAKADEIESNARARFVKAEIDARVQAIRETSAHERTIAQAEFEKIRTEANAYARQLEASLREQIARQALNGNVTLNNQPTGPGATAQAGEPAPGITPAPVRPAVVEPQPIADFRTALAEASKFRVEADAMEAEAYAQRDAETADFNAWWSEKVAAHEAWHARLDAFDRKAQAEVAEDLSRVQSVIAAANAERSRAEIDAESTRKQTIARIETLRAGAEALGKKSTARVAQLRAEAEATARNGETKIASLEVRRDSTARRGEATVAQLAQEADALETSQRAIVAQMRQEIQAQQQILQSELARLDQTANTFKAVAEANFNEAIYNAEVFERITIANTQELTAQHIAARKIAQADLAYLRDLNNAQRSVAEAEIVRMVANAEAQINGYTAEDLSRRANIAAQHRVAQASVGEQLRIAGAEDSATYARFQARVVQTDADRNRAYADVYYAGIEQGAQAERALAEAAAYREISNGALTRLSDAVSSFNTAAQQNWDSRLAQPAPLPLPASNEALVRDASQTLNNGQVVSVPTDTD